MGVSIHYSGKLQSANQLPALLEEVKDIANIFGWTTTEFLQTYPDNKFELKDNDEDYGIILGAPHCEPIVLIFDYEGKICAPWIKQFMNEEFSPYIVHCKTQFAGADVHIKVVEMFRYLSKKYFNTFEFLDEADYWETKNKQLVEEKIEFLDKMISQFAKGVANTAMQEGESMENYLLRIAQKIKE